MKLRPRSKPARKTTRGRPARVTTAPRSKATRRGRVTLQADCTLSQAEGLKKDLSALLKHAKTVTLDATAVERIDTASLQLLAAFIRDRRLAGRSVEWFGNSDALQSAARLLGMDVMLSLSEAAS